MPEDDITDAVEDHATDGSEPLEPNEASSEQVAAEAAEMRSEPTDAVTPFDADQLSALAVLDHVTSIDLERSHDMEDKWYVIDRSYAEPEVNWPGADLGGPFSLDKAIRVRKEAQADVLHRWRNGLPSANPYEPTAG